MAVDWKKILILSGIGVVTYAGIRYLLPPAVPFLLGWLLASLVLPAAKWMEKKLHIKRGIAGGILIGTASAGVGFGLWKLSVIVVTQGEKLLKNVGVWTQQAELVLNNCCQMIENYTGIHAGEARNFLLYQAGRIQEEVQNKLGSACLEYLVTAVRGIIVLAGGILVTVIFGTLIIKDMENFRKRMEEGTYTRRLAGIWRKICYAGGRYMKAQFVLMGIITVLCVAGFWILGNPYFAVAGIAVGVLDALPLIGAGTILIPWAILWLLKGEYLLAVGYLVLYLAADLTRQFLEPRILGREIGLHPAVMLIAVYGGFFLYGFAGFFLGPVTVLILKIAGEEILNKKDAKKSQKS